MNDVKRIAERLKELKLEYPVEIPKEILEEAKNKGIVIVYGSSDDLMEFDGAIYDEVGAYEGGECFVNGRGITEDGGKRIEALWHDEGNPCFTYMTDIPHETFYVWEDGEKYCVGIVFDLGKVESKTERLLRLAKENPTLPIVPMVNSEVCNDDSYSYWLGEFDYAVVDEYVCVSVGKYGDSRFYTKVGQEEIEELFADEILNETDITEEEAVRIAHEKAENLPWKKAIIVYIELPEVE